MNDIFKDVGPTYRATQHRPKVALYQGVEVHVRKLMKEHSSNAYFVTIGLGRTSTLSVHEEWVAFGPALKKAIDTISANYLIAGLVVGIEMYSKSKGRANSKALKPHAHITIITYNDFLELPIEDLEEALLLQKLDYKVQWLKSPHDITKSITYAVKSGTQDVLQQATKMYFGNSPVSLVRNVLLPHNPMEGISRVLRAHYNVNEVEAHYLMKVPSVGRFNGDVKLQMADFLRKVCLETDTTFYDGSLLRRTGESKYTWTKYAPVEDYIHILTSAIGLSETYKQNLYNSANWIINEGRGSKGKHKPIQAIFPRMRICPHLWEFKGNDVYDCEQGVLLFEPVLSPFTSCAQYHRITWEELPLPVYLAEALQILVPELKDRKKLLVTLGGLFHSLDRRKGHKAIWISGASRTFKSWFMQSFLDANFNQLTIHQVSMTESKFKYGRLRGIEEGILHVDEFRSANFPQPAELLALTDGKTIMIEEKFEAAEKVSFKGHPVITSNERIRDTRYDYIDQKALETRYNETTFVQTSIANEQRLQEIEDLLKDNPIEWVSLAIMANRAFLMSKGKEDIQVPTHWTYNEQRRTQ